MSPRKRATAKKTQLKQDKLVNAIFLFTKWVKEKQSIAIGGVVGLAIVIILAGVMASSRKKSAEKANELLGKAEVLYSAGAYDKATPLLTNLIRNHGGGKQFKLATFLMANSLFNQGNYHDARDYYARFIKEAKDDDLLVPSAIAGIGACLEGMGNYLEAGEKYLEAAKDYPDYYLAPQYLLDAGRCFLQGKEPEKARGAYNDLISAYAQTEYSDQAELALAEIP